jgi:hypothetical protein
MWGQLAIWDVLRWLPPHDTSLNMLGCCDVPADLTTGQVLEALGALVERHDVLRSRFRDGPDGPVQQVTAEGDLVVEIREAGAAPVEDCVDRYGEELRARPFDDAAGPPLRPLVLTEHGRPVLVLLAVSHMAVDGWSLQIVTGDLTALLAGEPLPPPGQQPLERARYEAGEQAALREKQALAYWAEHIERLPARMIARVRGERAPDFTWAGIGSPALARAAESVSLRCGTEPGVVLLGATALLLSAYTGEPDAALRTIVSTRFLPASRRLVAAFNQNALFHIGRSDETFPGFVSRCRKAALLAYRHSEYDPRELEAMIGVIARRRGLLADGYCFFNDTRFGATRPTAGPDPAAADTVAADVPGRLAETVITVPETPNTPKGANFFLFLHRLDDTAELALCVENGFLTPRAPADFLRDLERLVVRGALSQEPVADLWEHFRVIAE